jgi:PAS domain S-box-containing protein
VPHPAAATKAEVHYRALFNDASDAIMLRRFDGTIVEANRATAELTGYTVDELAGKNISEMVTPEGLAVTLKGQKALLKDPARPQRYQLELLCKDGRRIPIESVARISSVHGEIYDLQVIIRDMSQHKRMERMLLEREKTFHAIAEQSNDGILIARTNDNYVYANQSAILILGYSREDFLGMTIADIVHSKAIPLLRRRNRYRKLGKHPARHYETTFLRKDGRAIPVEVVEAKAQWQGEATIWMIFHDIEERSRLRNYVNGVTRAQEEERLRIARELHDDTIQSLAVLSLEIQALARNGGFDETSQQKLEELRRKTNEINDGVRRFTYELRPAVLDKMGLIPALEALTAELNQQTKMKAHVETSGTERRLSAELELALFRIAQEATGNARKYAQARHVVVKVEFKRGRILLTVSDNGRGFNMPRNTADFIGPGKLGLIGIQERVRLFSGRLSISSTPGKGTTLTASVPG